MSHSCTFLGVLGVCLLVFSSSIGVNGAINTIPDSLNALRKLKECFTDKNGIVLCLKERALESLNETVVTDDRPISIFGIIDIVRDPTYNYTQQDSNEVLPGDITERSMKLDDMLYNKVEEYIASRTVKIHLGDVFEGRGKKGKKGAGMLMMGGLAMAGMMAQLFMGKIAFLAGTALLIAKMALVISAVVGLKKLASSGGGGESAHVVYAQESGSHGGGGGWHRNYAEDLSPYRAYAPTTSASDRYTSY